MVLAREAYVHRKNAYHQRGKHDGDGNDSERFNQPVQVVADDRYARVHHTGENVRVDFGLFVALAVFDEHIVDEFQALAADPDLGRVVFQTFDQLGVGIYAVKIVNQALFQADQVQKILVLHRSVDLLFEGVGDRIDDLQVFVEMEDRTVDHLQHKVLKRSDLGELFPLKQRHVVAEDKDKLVGKEEQSRRCDLEHKAVRAGVVARAFENDGLVFRLELEPGQLVRIKGRCQGVFIQIERFHELFPILLIWIYVDIYAA